jgi:hypothetical protein
MNEITHNIRKAGYVDPNQFDPNVVRYSMGLDTGNINGKTYNFNNGSERIHGSPLIYFNGGSTAPDALAIYFDEDPLNIVYQSFHSIVRNGVRFLEKTQLRCLPETFGRPGCTNLDNEKMFGNLEQIKFTFFDKNGQQLLPSSANRGAALFTTWTGAITSSIDPLLVNYVQISIIFKSQNEIYKNNVAKSFRAGGYTFSYNDKYYREILTASVYPRNIIKK